MLFEFDCRGSIWLNSKIFPWVPNYSDPNNLGHFPEIKILLAIYLAPVLRKDKTKGGDRFSTNRPLSAQNCTLRPTDQRPLPKNYLNGVGLVLKISLRCVYSIKNYSTFSQEHTNRHTNTLAGRQTHALPSTTFTTFMKYNFFHGYHQP